MSNLDRYKKDLKSLIATGEQLLNAINAEFFPDQFEAETKKKIGAKKAKEFIAALPSFALTYQSWYSEARVLIRQLLPDRLEDFVRHYEKPKARKNVTLESYRIEDCLQGLSVNRILGSGLDPISWTRSERRRRMSTMPQTTKARRPRRQGQSPMSRRWPPGHYYCRCRPGRPKWKSKKNRPGRIIHASVALILRRHRRLKEA